MALKLSRKQKHYYTNSNAKINVSHGAVRSGKTFITNLRWLNYIRHGPPGKLLMSGRTKESLKANVLDDIFAMVGEENYQYNASTGILRLFGRKIECKGAEKITSESAIRGRTYAGWYADEVTIQHKEFVKQAIARCSVPKAQIFWTTNPDHPKHFIKIDYLNNKRLAEKEQLKQWQFYMDDNATLTSDYIELLKASFSGVFYDRNVLGEWAVAEGRVYQDYSEKSHNVSREQIQRMIAEHQFMEYIAGTDWGISAPIAGNVYGVTRDYKFYQIAEFYKNRSLTQEVGRWYLQQEAWIGKKISVIYCDSAENDRTLELQKMGLRAIDAHKEIDAGLNTVMTLFKNDRLFVCSETCSNTVNELLTYRYPEPDDPKAALDTPIDADNHSMDAMRYCLHNYLRYRRI